MTCRVPSFRSRIAAWAAVRLLHQLASMMHFCVLALCLSVLCSCPAVILADRCRLSLLTFDCSDTTPLPCVFCIHAHAPQRAYACSFQNLRLHRCLCSGRRSAVYSCTATSDARLIFRLAPTSFLRDVHPLRDPDLIISLCREVQI